MEQPSSNQRSVRTIRLDDEQITRLLDQLDGVSASDGKSQQYSYRVKALVVHMQQPGSSITVPYSVASRYIGDKGLAFLHGGFVHPGTRCLAQPITSYGTWDDVLGTVTESVYVEGNIHEVTIKFDRPIDPSVYCAAAVNTRVLLAEDDASTARLAKFYLEQLNASVDIAENGLIAVKMSTDAVYDIILMDIEMPEMNGFDAVKELRKKGYSGTVVACTALTQPEDQQKCLDAGFDRYVAKPLKRDQLDELLQALREEPLFSTLYNDPSMIEMIDSFVQELGVKVRDLESAMSAHEMGKLELIVRTMKGEGTGYGFEAISDAASSAEKALLDKESEDVVRGKVKALAKLCLQARAPTAPT